MVYVYLFSLVVGGILLGASVLLGAHGDAHADVHAEPGQPAFDNDPAGAESLLALFLSALTVHYRDIRDLLQNLLMFWFFATPIIYPWQDENVRQYKWLFDINPFTHLAVSYQEILFFPGPVGHATWLMALGAASVVVFFGGYWFFDRLRDSFAEAV